MSERKIYQVSVKPPTEYGFYIVYFKMPDETFSAGLLYGFNNGYWWDAEERPREELLDLDCDPEYWEEVPQLDQRFVVGGAE
ncbi:MAG: hypothetical protein CME36_09475 [unclassified Hahellaceae]|nr:hypothetical protein [Hahellaceae bacterium]|tara:strand:- start:8720 stop:8965 length:246 start_codon:yes stop_codon:yes gene_type:complete